MPRICSPVQRNCSRSRISGRRRGGSGREGGRERRRGCGARGRRVQRERAHGRGGDAEGIGLARAGTARLSGQRGRASASTSDLTAEGIRQLVDGALALARVTEEDPFAGLPETGEFGAVESDLHLYFDDVYSLAGAERIEWARRAEAAALAGRPAHHQLRRRQLRRCHRTQGVGQLARLSTAAIAPATQAWRQRRWPRTPTARMQRDGWWSSARRLSDLESPEAVGAEAARRTLRRLGARRVATQRVPIIFAPETARTLIGSVFEAASGDAIWRGASFLAGKAGRERLPRPA